MSAVIVISPVFNIQLSAIPHTPDHMTWCDTRHFFTKWVWLEMRPVVLHNVFWEGVKSKEKYVNISQIIWKIVVVYGSDVIGSYETCISIHFIHAICSIVNTIVALC